MKNANFYLSFLSLAVIGFSSYTIYGMFRQPQITSAPQVLGETNSPPPPESGTGCTVGLSGFALGNKCTPPSTLKNWIMPNLGPGITLPNLTIGSSMPVNNSSFYDAASFECADGTKGNVQKPGNQAKNNLFASCLPEAVLKIMAERECMARSSCGLTNYTPCIEINKIKELLACSETVNNSATTGVTAACNRISNTLGRFCPAFALSPKSTKAPKSTLTPKPQSCKSGTKTLTAIKDKTCPSGQYRKIRYTCQAGKTSEIKTMGDNTTPCRTLEDLKNSAALTCDPRGTCPAGYKCDNKTCLEINPAY